jgi:hypothetical protein
MPRPLSGHLETRVLADGLLAFYAKIRADRHALGREPEWTQARAERFLNATLLPAAKLGQPWWDLIPSLCRLPGYADSAHRNRGGGGITLREVGIIRAG